MKKSQKPFVASLLILCLGIGLIPSAAAVSSPLIQAYTVSSGPLAVQAITPAGMLYPNHPLQVLRTHGFFERLADLTRDLLRDSKMSFPQGPPSLDEFVRMSNPKNHLKQSFSGVRAIGNEEEFELKPEHRLAFSLYAYLYMKERLSTLSRPNGHTYKLVMAMDSRPSGIDVLSALTQGFRMAAKEAGVSLEIENLGILTTPLTASAIRTLRADGGVMVTASHNPLQDNGIKFFTAHDETNPVGRGSLLSGEAMRMLIQQFEAVHSRKDLYRRLSMLLFPMSPVPFINLEAIEQVLDGYLAELRRLFPQSNLDDLIGKMTIAVDANGGAGSLPVGDTGQGLNAWILAQMGLQVHEVQAVLGKPNHGIEPVGMAMRALRRLVQRLKLMFGVAFDFDADRGTLEPQLDHQTAAALHVMNALAQMDAYHQADHQTVIVVVHDATSKRIEDIAALFNRPDRPVIVRRVETGEVNVVEAMQKARSENAYVPIGVEGANGGAILGNQTCRDGIATALLTAVGLADPAIRLIWAYRLPEHARALEGYSLTLREMAAMLPSRVTHSDSIFGIDLEKIPEIKVSLENEFLELLHQHVSWHEKYSGYEFHHFQGTRTTSKLSGDRMGGWMLLLRRHPDQHHPEGQEEFIWMRSSRTGPELRWEVDALDNTSSRSLRNAFTKRLFARAA